MPKVILMRTPDVPATVVKLVSKIINTPVYLYIRQPHTTIMFWVDKSQYQQWDDSTEQIISTRNLGNMTHWNEHHSKPYMSNGLAALLDRTDADLIEAIQLTDLSTYFGVVSVPDDVPWKIDRMACERTEFVKEVLRTPRIWQLS